MMFIVLVIFNSDPAWSYGILIKLVKISIEFLKKNPDMKKLKGFNFRDQSIKIVQKKVPPLNDQILCWSVWLVGNWCIGVASGLAEGLMA